MTTFIFAATLLALLATSLLLWAWLLSVGLRWVKTESVTVTRLAIATLLTSCANIGLAVISAAPAEVAPELALAIVLAEFLFHLLITFWIIAFLFELSVLRAAKAWLPTLAGQMIMVTLVFFVFRPYVSEAFVVPTNSMAPTIVGWHVKGVCSECGSPAFASPPRDYSPTVGPWICQNEFHVTQTATATDVTHDRDRILVAKYLKPRRWDLVVFKYPEETSQLYIMRLVGMPGESITIEDGEVFANQRLLERPESIRGIYYESEMDYEQIWGAVERPAQLGDDEYFVLGDFSQRAKDSRLWYDGAPGHPAYAVPASYIVGVATHIYWPPRRWRKFR